MPLLCLALLGVPSLRRGAGVSDAATGQRRSRVDVCAAGLAVLALLLFIVGLVLSYHVPCGSEFYRWSLCYQPQYKNWAPESVSSPPIGGTLALTQEIVPVCDGMTELRVWVNSPGSNTMGTTSLTLRAPTEEKNLLHTTYRNLEIPDRGWLTARFPPDWSSNGRLYLLILRGSGSDGIRVGYSEKPEYLAGRLTENDAALGRDILFQYGCLAGLQKIVDGAGAP